MTQSPRISPLRVKFVITSLPVGGAETLLLNLIRRMDKQNFAPEVICLKQPGVLGEQIASEVPVHTGLLASKWDLLVLPRLSRLFRDSATDAVITVGAGDKMFWGRLAAKMAQVPVICSALHSTGWPDGVGKLNRLLTPITDGFIACARGHAEYLIQQEGFPSAHVFMIPNGVDTERFHPASRQRIWLRKELSVPAESQLVGIVAALRPEKNHSQFIYAAREVLRHYPQTHFVVVGEGPERTGIENLISTCGLASHFHLLGNRDDTERLLQGLDVFCLTSRNEANPVSILEALASGIPVVSPDVGSISETVIPKKTGVLTKPLCAEETADAIMQLLGNPRLANTIGLEGRQLVQSYFSLEAMVQGYENLIGSLYNTKALAAQKPAWMRKPLANPDGSLGIVPPQTLVGIIPTATPAEGTFQTSS